MRTIILISLVLIAISLPASAQNIASIGNFAVDANMEIRVPIFLNDSINVGSIGIELGYDPTIVKVSSLDPADKGNFIDFYGPDNSKNASGILTINTFKTGPGLNGNLTIGYLRLKAAGINGSISPLRLKILLITNETGDDISPSTAINGSFTIKGITGINDTIKPVINFVLLNDSTPNAGDTLRVDVNVTDNVAVTSVKANGGTLTVHAGHTYLWSGTFTAINGTHSVNVSASDASGNIAWNNSSSYTTTTPTTTPGQPLGRISGMKFNDANRNGTKDSGDFGLSNWTIVLKNSMGAILKTMVTDINGNYAFSELLPGNYAVEEVMKPDWRQTFPQIGKYNVTITTGGNVTGIDFGNELLQPQLPTGVNAVRKIEPESLRQGQSANITIKINGNVTQALALQEFVPVGWTVKRISDDADEFKNITNEWVWSNVTPGTTKTAVYSITPAANTTIGTYYFNGTISNSSGVIAIVGGNNKIVLDIFSYYRRLGSDPNKVETRDLLRAMDDRRTRTVPAGFADPITNNELLVLIDEWLLS